MIVVISQPMLFPWLGLFEQLRLADVFVVYDDVQFSRGSFTNRVQVKSPDGIQWLTIPLLHRSLEQKINEVQFNTQSPWRRKHLEMLNNLYARAPFKSEMVELVRHVYEQSFESLHDLVAESMISAASYFNLLEGKHLVYSSQLGIAGTSSQRVLAIAQALGSDVYITGHGARHYLDHNLFEKAGVRVEYMNYRRTPYPQLYGNFNPHVSILDLIANCGKQGIQYIHSTTTYWKDFIL